MLPFMPVVLILMIPIIAILTSHQQKMARILHERREGSALDSQVLAELAALRQQLAQQTLTIDDLSRRQSDLVRRIDGDSSIRDRLNA